MKLKKYISVFLALTMVLALFAGCGSTTAETPTAAPKAESPATEAPAASSAEPVNIVWAGWSGEEEDSKEIFGRMMDAY